VNAECNHYISKTLLIIGGTGFFGKSILDAYQRGLLSRWHIRKLIVLARNPDDLKHNAPELLSSNVEFHSADITTTETLPYADYVIHAAASSDAAKYLSQNELEKRNIISGTLNYCKFAAAFHQNSKIVYCSSGAIYGYQPPKVEFLSEKMALGSIEMLTDTKKSYAYAKRDCEIAMQQLGEKGLNVTIARCFAFYGKYLPRDQHFAIGNFLADAQAGRPISVKADRLVYRSYMCADDLVMWLMTLADHANSSCPIYNVGSDESIELHDLAQSIATKYGVSIIQNNIDTSLVDRYIPSVLLARNTFGLTTKKLEI
jgi:nucleoside-diphosphate-sugar epimerase